jgi:hypothetical protein
VSTTQADVERDAAAVAKSIRDLKATGDQNAEKISAIEAGLVTLRQTQDAYNRTQMDRSHAGGSNRELETYTRASEAEVKNNAKAYAVPGSGNGCKAVRLVGHDRVGDPTDAARSTYRVHGLFDDPNPKTDWQRQAQKLLDRRNFVTSVLNASRAGDEPKRRAWRCEAELIDHLRSGPEEVSRVFSDASGQGAAWIPDNPMPELERELLFRPAGWQMYDQVNMSRNPLLRPFKSGYLRAFKGQIPTLDDSAADPALSGFTPTNQVIEAAEVAVGAQIHLNAEEDAIVSFEQEIRTDIIDAQVFAIENARMNGDSAGTHQDAIASWDTRSRLGTTPALGGSNDQRRLWLGLRPLAYDLTSMTTDASAAPLTTSMILADLAKIKVESLLGSEGRVGVVIEISPETFFSTVINLPEFDAFDNVGVLASVLTGQLGDVSKTPGGLLPGQVGFLFGRFPVVVNYCITKDLAATGLYTGSGSTTGTLTHDVSRFQFFIRRGGMIQVADDIRNNSRTLVSRARMTFKPKDDVSASNKTCHWRYNVSA